MTMFENIEKKEPRVTCIVPVYNVEKYIRRCLDSILNQTVDDFEIICVDDKSPDGCKKILEEYQNKHPGKVYVLSNEENIGQGRSRIRALDRARGEFIVFIDSDDYIKEDYLEQYLNKMEEGDYQVVIGGYTKDIDGRLKSHYVMQSDWSVITYTIACAKMFRKSFLTGNEIDFSDKRPGEDIYFSLMVFYHIESYAVIRYAGYFYYFNSSSTTGKMNYKIDFEKTVAEMFDEFMRHCDMELVSQHKRYVIEYDYIAQMINALITYGAGGGRKHMKEKYDYYCKDRDGRFPKYRKNPYINPFKARGQTMKIRFAVGLVMLLDRIHLDGWFFNLFS